MGDTYSSNLRARLPATPYPWKTAEDAVELLESSMGAMWKPSRKQFEAETDTRVWFQGEDLIALRQRFEEHRGVLKRITVHAAYFYETGGLFGADIIVWVQEGGASDLWISWLGPSRVDVEAFRHATVETVGHLARGTRWKNSTYELDPVEVSSREEMSKQVPPSVIRTSGWVPKSRRWFIRNRDEIIIGLGASTVVSVGIIIIQAFFAR